MQTYFFCHACSILQNSLTIYITIVLFRFIENLLSLEGLVFGLVQILYKSNRLIQYGGLVYNKINITAH